MKYNVPTKPLAIVPLLKTTSLFQYYMINFISLLGILQMLFPIWGLLEIIPNIQTFPSGPETCRIPCFFMATIVTSSVLLVVLILMLFGGFFSLVKVTFCGFSKEEEQELEEELPYKRSTNSGFFQNRDEKSVPFLSADV